MAENPQTAVESEAQHHEGDTGKKHHKEKKKKQQHHQQQQQQQQQPGQPQQPHMGRPKHQRREKKWVPNFNIPGVHKLVLNENTQHLLGVTAGDKVTAEKPWIYVERDVLQENLEFHSESSELLPVKDQINDFAATEVLMGYVPDESNDLDEYYLCLTEDATDQVKEIITKMQAIQEERLRNAINKGVRPWNTLGSAEEIDCNTYRNNRPLIEVEIESKYPILPFKVHYRAVQSQSMKDGYMELRSSEEINCVQKKRIHTGTQVAPSRLPREAQTTCAYPRNAFTQYEYDIDEKVELTPELTASLNRYFEENDEDLQDMLKVNGKINFYKQDCNDLAKASSESSRARQGKATVEYLSFVNMELCEGKKIAGICFSPFWTGTVALSYVDVAPSLYITRKPVEDEVLRAVHGTNPVLLWSFLDDLRPKLILESPREVHSVKFCPFNENLLMGGCVNGQIILWDITNKLNKVEAEEILTADQQKYRGYMHSLMGWMKNIHDLALVRPTAVSDLKNSHSDCVNNIKWMSPFHKISKTGRFSTIPEDSNERSLQLITSSEDGCVLIWDLLMKPTVQAGGFKAVRRLKRLKKRPSALSLETSPFRYLHLNLRPIYRVRVNTMDHRPIGIGSFYMSLLRVPYKLDENFPKKKKPKLSDRLIYKAVMDYPTYPQPQLAKFAVGTLEGDFIEATWEGQDFDSGEVVNFEEARFENMGKYHDGPVHWLNYSRSNDIFMTVGGKVFALWSSQFKSRPFLWRKSNSIYTQGAFHLHDESIFGLSRNDGYTEKWMLYQRSKSCVDEKLASNGAINTQRTHDRLLGEPPEIAMFGFADYRGAFRLFYDYQVGKEGVESNRIRMQRYLRNEMARKRDFTTWQTAWNKKYNEMIEHYRKEAELHAGAHAEVNVSEGEPDEQTGSQKKAGNCNQRRVQWIPQPGDQERIKHCVLTKKQFDTELLKKQRVPLDNLERENEVKRKKQKIRLRHADKIFKDTVSMLFPDVIKEKPVPPPDPYESSKDPEAKRRAFDDYQEVAVTAQDYIEEHPFDYDFNWLKVLREGRNRRRRLDKTFESAIHKQRFADIKRKYFTDVNKSQKTADSTDDDGAEEDLLSEWDEQEAEQGKEQGGGQWGEQGGGPAATLEL